MHSYGVYESARKANALAGLTILIGISIFYTALDPAPAADDLIASWNSVERSEDALNDAPVPFPIEISDESLTLAPAPATDTAADSVDLTDPSGSEASATAVSESTVQNPVPAVDGIVLSNQEAIQFSLLLLRDGEKYLQGLSSYSAVFSKRERINGDLQEAQVIEMKIQHSPQYSVYMRWRNGDAGRQVLYSTQYEDGQMVVKLGGFKGRLIPAIKLDPNGDKAMSESRYPITRAGLHGMQQQVLSHREADLSRGYGVRCRRLPNQVFDETACLCFEFTYDSADISLVYRKSLILIDVRKNIVRLTRSYTWAGDSDGLSAEQLDEQTLIEDYSYSSINSGAELAAEEFSRDNPKYRM